MERKDSKGAGYGGEQAAGDGTACPDASPRIAPPAPVILRKSFSQEDSMNGTMSDDTLRARLDLPYAQAIERVTAALKDQGFGILTEIDVQATLKQKLGADFRKYTILGACNPPLAHQALTSELEIGLLLPCNVIVYEDDGGSVISIADPIAMLQLADNPSLEPVAKEARTRLQRVIAALSR
jgi:uncharacterized protein (DUF302 family)